jgi:hypothetical protein
MVGRNVFAIKDFNQLNEKTQKLSLDITWLSNGIYYIKLILLEWFLRKKYSFKDKENIEICGNEPI